MLPSGRIRFPGNDGGQMPFALVAVVLLLVTSYSMVIIAELEDANEGIDDYQRELEMLEAAVDETVTHVRSTSSAILLEISNESLKLSPGELEDVFNMRMSSVLDTHYPYDSGGVSRRVTSHNFRIDVAHLSMDPVEGGGSYPTFATVSGVVTVSVTGENSDLSTNRTIEPGVPVPLPLLNNLLSDHSLSVEGGRSELARLMSYQLGSLAQMRVLNGVSSIGDFTQLLTGDDVMAALDSSLTLMERKNMRVGADSVLSENSTLVDPAELLLLDQGEAVLDLNRLLAQSVFSIIDSTVLQWLEYLDFLRVPIGFLESLHGDLLHALDHLFYKGGFDMRAVTYLKERMSEYGHEEHEYRYLNPSGMVVMDLPTITVAVGEGDRNRNVDLSPGTVAIQISEGDVFKDPIWKSFFPLYRESTLEITRALQGLLRDVAESISASRTLPVLQLPLNAHDDRSFTEVLERTVSSNRDVINAALHEAVDLSLRVGSVCDDMSLELLDFIGTYRQTLFGEDSMLEELSASVTRAYMETMGAPPTSENVLTSVPSFWENMRVGVGMAMEEEGVRSLMENKVTEKGDRIMDLFTQVLQNDERSPSGISRTIGQLVSGSITGIPGLSESVSDVMVRMIGDISRANRVTHGESIMSIPSSGLILSDGEGQSFFQEVELDREVNIERLDVVTPSHVRGGAVHNVGLEGWDLASYSNTLIVRVRGSIDYRLSTGSDHPFLPFSEAVKEVGLDMELRIPVSSGWPLQGVDYAPSNTLGEDIVREVMGSIIPLMSHLEGSFEACDSLFRFIASMNAEVNSFVTGAMSAVADAVLSPILALQEALDDGLAMVMGKTLGGMLDHAGSIMWTMDLLGMRLEFETNPMQFSLGVSRDILRTTLSLNVSDVHLSVTLRLLKMTASDYYVIGTANMAMGDWSVSTTLDPSMRVYRHLVEAKGTIGNVGFHIRLPQVMQYETFSLRLSQIPALGTFLSNIPLPVPGMGGSIDAGLELKYDVPLATDVVVNEVEGNPPGSDAGREWVELFNPLDQGVELDGWYMTTGKGDGRRTLLPEMTLGPGERHIHVFRSRTLNNGDSMTLPRGDAVLLWNDEGSLVDSTPWMVDTDDCSKTWQREFDGADQWVFAESTQAVSNGPPSKGADLGKWIVSELRSAAMTAISRIDIEKTDMESFSDLLHGTFEILLDRILQRVASCIVETKLFIFMGVSDASSSLSAGLELSLVAGREFVLEGLRWIAASLRQAVDDILNPGNGLQKSTAFLMEESHLRLSLVNRIGPPDFIGSISDDDSYEMRSMVQMNLVSLASTLGKAQGERKVGFGVMLSEVPGVLLPPMFRVDPNRNTDVWLMRGTFDFGK